MLEQHERFTGEVTTYIKGIAIVLMICNHLYPIPEFIFPENQYFSLAIGSKTLAAYIGGFGKICVAIYTILTGIGLYHTYSNKEKAYEHTLRKLISFYLVYWVILIGVYIPVMQIAGVWDGNLIVLIKNMIGYKTTYCKVAWYVFFYMELIITFPIYVKIFKKMQIVSGSRSNKSHVLFICELVCLVATRALISKIGGNTWIGNIVGQYLNYIPFALLGYYCAKYSIFEKVIAQMNRTFIKKWQKYVITVVGIGLVVLLRGGVKELYYFNMDLIYASIVIMFLFFIKKQVCGVLNKIISVLGKYSTELWFLHAIFFIGSATVQKIAYWPRIDILILVWTIILLLPMAYLIRIISDNILKLFIKGEKV